MAGEQAAHGACRVAPGDAEPSGDLIEAEQIVAARTRYGGPGRRRAPALQLLLGLVQQQALRLGIAVLGGGYEVLLKRERGARKVAELALADRWLRRQEGVGIVGHRVRASTRVSSDRLQRNGERAPVPVPWRRISRRVASPLTPTRL